MNEEMILAEALDTLQAIDEAAAITVSHNEETAYGKYVARMRAKGKKPLSKSEWEANNAKLKKALKVAGIATGSVAAVGGAVVGGKYLHDTKGSRKLNKAARANSKSDNFFKNQYGKLQSSRAKRMRAREMEGFKNDLKHPIATIKRPFLKEDYDVLLEAISDYDLDLSETVDLVEDFYYGE